MRGMRSRYIGFVGATALTLLPMSALETAPDAPDVAFFYGHSLPVEELAHYDRVVVEADNTTDDELRRLRDQGVEVFAYLSLGEISRSRSWHGEIDPRWVLGSNKGWDSDILDQESEGWRRYVLERKATPFRRRGFAGLFLDTLDSYERVAKGEARRRQAAGQAGFGGGSSSTH